MAQGFPGVAQGKPSLAGDGVCQATSIGRRDRVAGSKHRVSSFGGGGRGPWQHATAGNRKCSRHGAVSWSEALGKRSQARKLLNKQAARIVLDGWLVCDDRQAFEVLAQDSSKRARASP
jgi:hypothetical protein